MDILKKFLIVSMTLLSLISFLGSPVGFPPAIALTLFLIAISGVIATFGYVRTATLNIAITSISIMISPLSIEHFESAMSFLVFCVPVLIGYSGLFIGVSRLQRKTST